MLSVAIIPSETTGEMAKIAKQAESYGYERFMMSDSTSRDAYSVLAICAAETSKIHIGPSVTNPFIRHPLLTAASIATIDELSQGRAILGIGAGGVSYQKLNKIDKKLKPVVALKEAITIIKKALAGVSFAFSGEYFQLSKLKEAEVTATPLKIPLLITSINPLIQQLAGELADMAMVGCTYISRDNYQKHVSNIIRGATAANRRREDIELITYLCLCCSKNGDLARESAKIFVAKSLLDHIKYDKIDPRSIGLSWEDIQTVEKEMAKLPIAYAYNYSIPPELGRVISSEMVDNFAITGTPEECVDGLKKVISFGFDKSHLYLVPVLGYKKRYDGYNETLKSFSEAWSSTSR